MTLDEARERLTALLPYLRRHGGVTVSGGEPCLQADFVVALFRIAHELGLSTVLDTNGSCPPSKRQLLLNVTDLVLLDVKASNEKLHQRITGRPLEPVLAFGRLAAQIPGRLVIRRVLLPGINDSAEELNRLTEFAQKLDYLPEIELLPYHRLGAHKWHELGFRYPLEKLKPPSTAQWKKAAERLTDRGLTLYKGTG